jgi:SAM-dependent methyltransferase
MQTRTAPILPGVTEPLAHDLQAMAGAGAYNDWLIDRARPWLHGRVLDVGAGIGTHTRQLLGLVDEVVALEPESELAELLRRNVDGAEVVVGDVSAVDGPFDAIVCFNVLEHIPDDEATLRRFRELLAPSGALLLLVPAHPFLYGKIDDAFGHERRYVKEELGQKLRRAGLEPEVLRHVNPVGALGWLTQSRIRRRDRMSYRGLDLYDRLVPALRLLDNVRLPVGLSLWAVAKTSGIASASARNA